MSRRLPVLAILALGAFAILPGAAGAYVYWTNSDTIGRANLDGTEVDQGFIVDAGDPRGVAVDAGHLYWANGDRDTIGRAKLDGTNVDQSFITGAKNPVGVAVDANHVYWANVQMQAGGGSIGRAKLDGSGVDQSFAGAPIDNGTLMGGVAVDSRHVYWTDYGRIGRADLDGTDRSFIGGVVLGASTSLAVDANHLYWTSWSGPTIAGADLDGLHLNAGFITGAYSPDGVAVDADHVYWTNSLNGTPANGIGRANLDGTGADQAFITGASNPFGVAVDTMPDPTTPDTAAPDVTAPETQITKGARNKSAKTRLKFRFTASELGATFECKLDAKAYRACESPHQVRRLAVGKHHFRVRAIDAAGNVDPSAAKDKFEVDRAEPASAHVNRPRRGRAKGKDLS